MNTQGNEFIEVPEPLFKYGGDEIIHHDNLAIMSQFEHATILDKDTVKSLQTRLKGINAQLQTADVDSHLSQMDILRQEFNSLRISRDVTIKYLNTLAEIFREQNDYRLSVTLIVWRLIKHIRGLRDRVKLVRQEIATVKSILNPYRKHIRARQRIQQKLKSHFAAVEDERKSQILQKGMAEEANIIADQMITTLSRLGFNHRVTIGKKSYTDTVQFEYIVATPDQLQLKINASKQGLFGGSIDLLPNGVYVTELIKPTVMQELSIALEREVWSPHTSDESAPLINGAWIIVERLGLVEGIPRNITYKQLMARYETADHHKIPIPAGIKRGRRINWVHLDSPQGVHMMFTGITGSGKSNAMRAMVSAIVENQSPEDIIFVFVDLKRSGDFREFESAPHCIRLDDKAILTEIDEVVSILQQVRSEMHMRQQKIGSIANNIIDYNKRVQAEHKMPRIVIVFDEFANTRRSRFSEQSNIIDDICIEISQVGRAFGISLWIGIQQPRRDNMPSALRDNITTQFVGHQSNIGAAQSVTGSRDSLKLEDIPGRMLATVGWHKFKVQMPFISEEDVKLAVQNGIDNYGDVQPYQLVSMEDTDNYTPITNEEIVLNLAMEEFNGALKIYPMHEILKGQMSRNEIKKIVEQFRLEGTVEYEGQAYSVELQSGNFLALIPVDNENAGSQAYHNPVN